MGQEFFVKSETLESKVRDLLPSQGGLGAGFDLSASTQIVPVIDLTESAEGSNVRADLQTAFSHDSATAFSVSNTTSTIISNTGYYRLIGTVTVQANASGAESCEIILNDGATDKTIYGMNTAINSSTINATENIDFIVFLKAGDTLKMTASNQQCFLVGSFRQIADIDGNLVNP